MVLDYGLMYSGIVPTEKIPISEFKATCLAVIERVRTTRQPVLITRFGLVVAEINPPPPVDRQPGWVGRMVGQGRIVGDLISPAFDPSDWGVLG